MFGWIKDIYKRREPFTQLVPSRLQDVGVVVRVNEEVLTRIHHLLANSNIEEGGKLVGYITYERKIEVTITSYLDSGPLAQKSVTHIIPDGNYQDDLFQILLKWDQQVEHVGSWHSHHCNGYPTLSKGDIEGYLHNVNNSNYNANIFVALLIKSVGRNSMDYDIFIFMRNSPSYYVIPKSTIQVVKIKSRLNELLSICEALTLDTKQSPISPYNQGKRGQQTYAIADNQSMLLLQDKEWISEHFPSATLMRSHSTGILSWKWFMMAHDSTFEIRYTYDSANSATLRKKHGNYLVEQATIALDSNRHSVINNFLATSR